METVSKIMFLILSRIRQNRKSQDPDQFSPVLFDQGRLVTVGMAPTFGVLFNALCSYQFLLHVDIIHGNYRRAMSLM